MKLSFKQKHYITENIATFIFETPASTRWEAGQAMNFEVATAMGREERWFTISSAPYERDVALTTRLTGSRFKVALDNLLPGDTIAASGLGGTFTWREAKERRKLFIAGGIGITPFRAMLLQRHRDGLPLDASLVCFSDGTVRLFEEELMMLQASHPEFQLHYLPATDRDGEGLYRYVTDPANHLVYVAGPERMVEAWGQSLTAAGLPTASLIQDWFPGYEMASLR